MSPVRPDKPEPADGLIAGILQRDEQSVPDADASELLTFVIADIRGYTRFTQERGDEAAAKLTAKLAVVVRDVVAQFGGTVAELRGDEALCVFTSPRQSLRVAVALQRRFVAETVADADLPMPVGIGVDVGEAVHGPDGYRGGALNLAARLCERARAGEVLASHEVTHLARTIDGIRYQSLDRVTIKGLTNPVRPVRVLPDGEDPVRQIAALLAAASPPPRPPRMLRWLPAPLARRPRTTVVSAAIIAAGLVATSLVVVINRDNGVSAATLGENSIGVLDPKTGRLVDQVGVDAGPIAAAAGFGSVWTVNTGANTVSRVDTSSRHVRSINVGRNPSAIAVGKDSMWVANGGDGSVSRIDPETNQALPIPVGSGPGGVAVSDNGSVWVTNTVDGTVSRIDPTQNKVVDTTPVGNSPTGISAGRDVWVANAASNTVTRINSQTGGVVEPITVGVNPKGIAVVGDYVWVSNNLSGTVTRIPTTDTARIETVRVGDQPTQLAAIGGHIWVATQAAQKIVEIDPESANRVVRTVGVSAVPGGMTVAAGKLWVTTTIDPARHTGGTIHILGDDLVSIDPMYIQHSTISVLWLLNGSYDGLVGYRHASGADGTAIVPDLATKIPTPTNEGRTYTFQLRDGIRFSNGHRLTVLDIQRGIERTIASGFAELEGIIVGARGCRPKRCFIPGITVNAAARTVTINLVHANNSLLDFLAASTIASPFATPLAEQATRPLPATGPYQVARYIPGKLALLTRNPYFHEWSAAAQPAGFPDTIEWQVDPKAKRDPAKAISKRGVDAVEAGRTDWASADGVAAHGTLEARFGSRLRTTPAEIMQGVSLNTRIPPFNDPRVRQALALAIDRDATTAAWDGPAETTCQFLLPNSPGYRPYCPYTLRPDLSGTWHGSDFLRAQALVKASPTTGMAVTVYAPRVNAAGMQHVVAALKQLGYHANLVVQNATQYYDYVANSKNKVQAAYFGWVVGTGTPAAYLSLWRCDAFHPGSKNNQNIAQFCDPAIDRKMDQADRLQTSSAGVANELWAEIDQDLVDAASWVPLVSLTYEDVLSTRVHNFQRSPALGVLFDQMWLR
jgi:YVTN family beta-propeller protein